MYVGRYEIVRELGRGGMARVHLARQLDLDRCVALKELGSLLREDAEMVARFLRESRVAGALNHTCIVTVLDFFEHDGSAEKLVLCDDSSSLGSMRAEAVRYHPVSGRDVTAGE